MPEENQSVFARNITLGQSSIGCSSCGAALKKTEDGYHCPVCGEGKIILSGGAVILSDGNLSIKGSDSR